MSKFEFEQGLTVQSSQEIQDTLFDLIDCIGESAYESFTNGEITQEELMKVYNMLRQSAIETERLLSLLE